MNYGLWLHLPALIDLSAPMIANALLSDVQNMITLAFVGRIGAKYMGAYVLGNML